MRRLIVALCLIASICAYHGKKSEFDVVITGVEYSNIPKQYNLGSGLAIQSLADMMGKLVEKLDKDPRAGTEAILNDFADKIFANLDGAMIENGLDPVALPDLHTGFNYTLIITWDGELWMTQGWLSDLSTLHRGGDVVVSYSTDDKYLEITLPIAFNDLMFTYDYSATIMGLGPSGGIDGKVSSVAVEAKIGFSAETYLFTLDEFYITNAGDISLEFNGNDLVDWLLNLLSDVATTVLKEAILLVVEGVIRDGLNGILDTVNTAIGGFLNPTTAVPATTVAALFYQ